MSDLTGQFYCANQHGGGAVVGAASVLHALPQLAAEGELIDFASLEVIASTAVMRNLNAGERISDIPQVLLEVRDDRPSINALWRRPRLRLDTRLSFRGPEYAGRSAQVELVGFADGSMFRRSGEPATQPGRRARAAAVAKRSLLRRYDAYVVQTELMAGIVRRHAPGKPVSIIPNSPSDVFWDSSKWVQTALPHRSGALRLFYPARAYPHKNHRLIVPVARELDRAGVAVELVTTLTPSEFRSLPDPVRSLCVNVGSVPVHALPPLYEACDGTFFPSLNETSSATPLESQLMRRPVFASNLEFIRDPAGPAPFYFAANDAADAAHKIVAYFADPGGYRERLESGHRFVASLPNATERARRYIEMLREPPSS